MSRQTLTAISICLLAGAIYGVMTAFTSELMEGTAFVEAYYRFSGGSKWITPTQYLDYVQAIGEVDNRRLGNILYPLMIVHKTVHAFYPVIFGFLIACMLWLMSRLSGYARNRAVVTVSLTWLLATVMLPWRDSMFVPLYWINYVAPTVLMLTALLSLVRIQEHGSKPMTVVCALACAALTGAWHEGFGLPFAAGLGVYALSRPKTARWTWWAACGLCAATTVAFLLCPGMLMRASHEGGESYQISWVLRALNFYAVAAYVMFAAIAMTTKRGCKALKISADTPQWTVLMVAMSVGTVIGIFVLPSPRTLFMPSLCAVVLIMNTLCPIIKRTSSRVGGVIAAACVVLCTVHGCACIYWQRLMYADVKTIEAYADSHADNTMFYDVRTQPEQVPFYTLYFVYRHQAWLGYQFFNPESPNIHPWLSVVPTAMRKPKGHKLSTDKRVFTDGKNLWMKPWKGYKLGENINIKMKDAHGNLQHLHSYSTQPFATLDGDTLIYVRLWRTPVRE